MIGAPDADAGPAAANASTAELAARWQRMEAFFHQALELDEADRVAQVRLWCGSDKAMCANLFALLEADSSVESLIAESQIQDVPSQQSQSGQSQSGESQSGEFQSGETQSDESRSSESRRQPSQPDSFLLREESTEDSSDGSRVPDPWIGRVLGAFQLESVLGRGGMGVVYLGQRRSGGFAQQVAIKLVGRHLRSSPAVNQFMLEREALAKLQHKNIAQLLDGGVTVEGIPYIVMEYVEGRRLDEVCDNLKDPSTALQQTVHLMLQLCDAVTYVHRNLILHRDLKPGNVMVTEDGTVKLLDFGTLKLMGTGTTDSAMTQAGMRPVTVRYASPEHILGELVSTASDVYSLGMMLYRLVAGRLPRGEPGGSNQLSIANYLDRVKEEKSPSPSSVKILNGQLAKDLDAIVQKAIRYDANDRYPTAEALAEDLRNALTDRPVAARDGTFRYNVGKFYRRNRAALLGTAAVLTMLVTGVGAIARESRIARAEQRRADAGLEDERSLAHMLLFDYFERLKQIPGSIDAQRKAVTQAVAYLDGLSRITDSQQLQLDNVEAYRRMALLQGDPYEQNIGDPDGALASLDKAQRIARALKTTAPHDMAVLAAFAMTQRTRSEVLFGVGRIKEAVASLRSAIDIYDMRVASPAATVAQFQIASNAYNGLGDELGQPGSSNLGDYAGALAAYRRDIELSQRALKIDPNYALSTLSIAIAHNKIGQILARTDPAAAIEAYRQSLAERGAPAAEKTTFRARRGLAVNYWDLGTALNAARDYDAAISAFEQGRKIIEAFAAADANDTRAQHDLAIGLSEEALVYIDRLDPELNTVRNADRKGYMQRAADLLQKSVAIQERIVAVDPGNDRWAVYLAYSQVMLGTLERERDDKDGARLAASGVAAIRRLTSGSDVSIETLNYATDAMLKVQPKSLRDDKLTIRYAERLVALDHRQSPDYLLQLAEAYHADGQIEKANAAAAEGLALLPPPSPGIAIPRTRKLLALEAQPLESRVR